MSKFYVIFFTPGAFSLGVPEETRCPMVLQPEHGRFVCSFGTLSERSMCLVECKIGFEQDRPPVVYICENSKWFDLTRKPISTPELQCIPKPVSSHEFAEWGTSHPMDQRSSSFLEDAKLWCVTPQFKWSERFIIRTATSVSIDAISQSRYGFFALRK